MGFEGCPLLYLCSLLSNTLFIKKQNGSKLQKLKLRKIVSETVVQISIIQTQTTDRATTDQLTIPLNKLTYSNPQNELPAQTIITNQPLSVQTISSTLQLEAKSTVEALIHQPTHTQYEFSRFFSLKYLKYHVHISVSIVGIFFWF